MPCKSESNGNNITFINGEWVYDDGMAVEDMERPCPKCKQKPHAKGFDRCLGELPGVKNACCGHGKSGYIQFKNGVLIRFDNLTVENKT